MHFDIHTHVTIKPYHNKNMLVDPADFPDPNHWIGKSAFSEDEETYNKLVDKLDKSLLIKSQGHLESMYEGGFRAITVSLYPLESGFTEVTQLMKAIAALLKRNAKKAIASIIGVSPEAINRISNKGYNYYQDLVNEAENLTSGPSTHRTSDGRDIRFIMVSNFSEMERAFQNPLHLALQLSIEGAHSFISNIPKKELKKLSRKVYNKPSDQRVKSLTFETIRNIEQFKSYYPSLFFVTFAHHFFNLMCGHAYTFNKLLFNQNPVRYARLGFTGYGLDVLECLLSRTKADGSPQRRVLIDTKHMSIPTRFAFHELIALKSATGDHIPIIQSHTAVNGRRSISSANALLKNKHWVKGAFPEEVVRYPSRFVPLDLNLFDDEIRYIINTDGLMGIMLDEKRICGDFLPEDINDIPEEFITISLPGERTYILNKNSRFKKAKKTMGKLLFKIKYCEQCLADPNITAPDRLEKENTLAGLHVTVDYLRERLKPISASLILNQLLYIAEVYGSERAWSHICIGSDFDGVINPLDTYPEARYLTTLKEDLLTHWNRMIAQNNDRYISFTYGLPVENILLKFLGTNALRFYSRYFTEEYLAQGITPQALDGRA